MNFSELVDQHIGASMRKQLALSDLLGKHSWQLDLSAGTVDFGKQGSFGKRRVYPIQVLGSVALDSGTWLWAWANSESNIPPACLRAAERVKAFGATEGITELITPELPASDEKGHLLAAVSVGIAGADCSYRGPYEGGAVFFLVFDTPLAQAPPTATVRIANVLTQVIGQVTVNHRAMARAFLEAEGFRIAEDGAELAARSADGRALQVRFDDLGRISGIETQAG
jgi:YD repeat-containing protein